MNYSAQFRNYLLNLGTSKVTVKNYFADVNSFVRWFEDEFQSLFSPELVTQETIDYYRKINSKVLSPSSIERHTSSLRKFFKFLKLNGQISQSPFELVQNSPKAADPYRFKDFKNYLYVSNASYLTIKNYINDIKQFLKWGEEVTRKIDSWKVEEQSIFNKLTNQLILEYKQRLIENRFSPRSINRKLSSLRKYLKWAEEEGLISEVSSIKYQVLSRNQISNLKSQDTKYKIRTSAREYSNFPPLRLFQKLIGLQNFLIDSLVATPIATIINSARYLGWKTTGKKVFTGLSSRQKVIVRNLSKGFYSPLSMSLTYLPLHKKILHHLKHTRPKWYRIYHSYSISHYAHLAILILVMSALGFALYDSYFKKPALQGAVLGALPQSPPRLFSFQGRLTDASDVPIITTTDLRFGLYDHETASGGALKWQEVQTVTPDTDGVFSVLLGKKSSLSQQMFIDHAGLWLGITVGTTSELTPRQQVASVAFAQNSDLLQGLRPITQSGAGTTNVVLALDSAGDLTIGGSATPTFQATGGPFTLSGNLLILNTVDGSNSDILIEPDGLGNILLQKPILNSTNNNNLTDARGAVEIDDLFAVLATSSGQSAFTLNQNGAGPIISASASGIARFTVDNSGNTTISGNFLSTLTASKDLGSSSVRWNNLWVQTINATGTNTSGQASFTYDPADTTYAQGTVLLNPTSAGPNELLLAAGIGGVERASIDTEGDLVIGFAGGTVTRNDNPLTVYNHGTTQVASINTSGNLFLGDGSGDQLLSINSGSTAGTDQGYLLFEEAGSDAMSLGYLAGSSSTTRELRIASGTGITATPRVTFEQGGNVGIGTTDPADLLTLVGGTNTLALRPTDGMFYSAGNMHLVIDSNNDTTAGFWSVRKDSAIFGGTSELFRVQEDGNVGIGTTSPIWKLTTGLSSLPTGTISTLAGFSGKAVVIDAVGEDLNAKTGYWTNFASPVGIAAGITMGRMGAGWGTFIGFHNHADQTSTLDSSPEVVRINQTGGVVIGTNAGTLTDPGANGLALGGIGQTGLLRIYNNTAGAQSYIQLSADNSFPGRLNINGGQGAGSLYNEVAINSNLYIPTNSVGIGTTSPGRTLDVVGNWGGNTVTNNQTDCATTVTISTKALAYRFTNTDSNGIFNTCTFNITGLPNTEGTFVFIFAQNLPNSPAFDLVNVSINGTSVLATPGSQGAIENGGVVYIGGAWRAFSSRNSDTADIAEWYPVDSSVSGLPEPGDIVATGGKPIPQLADSQAPKSTISSLIKSTKSYQNDVIGVISTKPYLEFGEDFVKVVPMRPLALAGRVPVKVSTENGEIKAGDYLTSSATKPGYAMKATKAGKVIGMALEPFNPTCTIEFGLISQNCTGQIMVFVNTIYYDPNPAIITTIEKAKEYVIEKALDEMGNIIAGAYVVKDGLGNVIERSEVLASAVIGNLRAGLVESNEIKTDIISPLSSDKVVIKLESGIENQESNPSGTPKLEVQNASGSAVATIDDEGNASFSGTLNSFGLISETASISGTLRTKNLVAENIESSLLTLKNQISSISGSLATTDEPSYADVASYSASLAYVDTLQAEVGTFMQGLFAVGPSSLSDVTVFGQLSIGTSLILADNSINVLGSNLQIQPLGQGGVSFLAGKVAIDVNGNLDVSGNATIRGVLFANVLSPVPGSELIEIKNASGSAVASVDTKGNATFRKLNLSLVEPAFALSETELIATGSAGIATISANFKEVTIQNELVTEKSLIYISPVGTPSAQIPFLVRQSIKNEFTGEESSFTVGVQELLDIPLPFNWLIIN